MSKRWIAVGLTFVGGLGVIATSYLASKATIKAKEKVYKLEQKAELLHEDLTKKEIVKEVYKDYIVTGIVGATTIACIFGSHALNAKELAGITGAYMILNRSYSKYKHKVKDVLGDGEHKGFMAEIAKELGLKNVKKEELDPRDDTMLFYDPLSDRYFERNPLEVFKALFEMNRMFLLMGEISLNEVYELLDLEETYIGREVGWSMSAGWEYYGYEFIETQFVRTDMDDGMKAYILEFIFDPTDDYQSFD